MTGEEHYIEHALPVGEELTGLSLEQLGFEIRPEQRDRSLFQAKLLAGALSEASAVLIDQLFEDLKGLLKLERIDRQDIANTFVLSGLPPRQADKYDVRFTQQFLVVAADMTAEGSRINRLCRRNESQWALVRDLCGPGDVAVDRALPAPEETVGLHQHHG